MCLKEIASFKIKSSSFRNNIHTHTGVQWHRQKNPQYYKMTRNLRWWRWVPAVKKQIETKLFAINFDKIRISNWRNRVLDRLIDFELRVSSDVRCSAQHTNQIFNQRLYHFIQESEFNIIIAKRKKKTKFRHCYWKIKQINSNRIRWMKSWNFFQIISSHKTLSFVRWSWKVYLKNNFSM